MSDRHLEAPYVGNPPRESRLGEDGEAEVMRAHEQASIAMAAVEEVPKDAGGYDLTTEKKNAFGAVEDLVNHLQSIADEHGVSV